MAPEKNHNKQMAPTDALPVALILSYVLDTPQSSYAILPPGSTSGSPSTYPCRQRSLHYCPCCFCCWAAGSTLAGQPLCLPYFACERERYYARLFAAMVC